MTWRDSRRSRGERRMRAPSPAQTKRYRRWRPARQGGPTASLQPGGEGTQLQDRVPVATRGPCAELPFDEGDRQPRTAEASRVDDASLPASGPDALRARDGRLGGRHVLCIGRILQKVPGEVARIALGFLVAGIAGRG